MPVQRGKSLLSSVLSEEAKQQAKASAAASIEYPNIELPEGIEGGVANLLSIEFRHPKFDGVEQQDKLECYMSGICITPEEHEGKPCKGLRTWQLEPLYDTPGRSRATQAEHIAWVQNQVKMLAILPGQPFDPTLFDVDNLEATAAILVNPQNPTYFRFSTWRGATSFIEQNPKDGKWYLMQKGKPVQNRGPYSSKETAEKANPYAGKPPLLNHKWEGKCAAPSATGSKLAVVDKTANSAPPISTQQQQVKGTASDVGNPNEFSEGNGTGSDRNGGGSSKSVPNPNLSGYDLDTLLKKAIADDGPAQDLLEKLFYQQGHTKVEFNAIDNWEDLVQAIKDSDSSLSFVGNNGEVNGFVPIVGNVYFFRPWDAKRKKPADPVECNTESVDLDNRTATLRSLVNSKIYSEVPFDSISSTQ